MSGSALHQSLLARVRVASLWGCNRSNLKSLPMSRSIMDVVRGSTTDPQLSLGPSLSAYGTLARSDMPSPSLDFLGLQGLVARSSAMLFAECKGLCEKEGTFCIPQLLLQCVLTPDTPAWLKHGMRHDPCPQEAHIQVQWIRHCCKYQQC